MSSSAVRRTHAFDITVHEALLMHKCEALGDLDELRVVLSAMQIHAVTAAHQRKRIVVWASPQV